MDLITEIRSSLEYVCDMYNNNFTTSSSIGICHMSGVDLGFSEGGRQTVMCGRMAVARGRVPWKLLPCVLMFVAKFKYLWHLHLFIAARFLLACVFRE